MADCDHACSVSAIKECRARSAKARQRHCRPCLLCACNIIYASHGGGGTVTSTVTSTLTSTFTVTFTSTLTSTFTFTFTFTVPFAFTVTFAFTFTSAEPTLAITPRHTKQAKVQGSPLTREWLPKSESEKPPQGRRKPNPRVHHTWVHITE